MAPSRNKLIQNAYINLSADGAYANTWICDETIYQSINARYEHIKTAVSFDRGAVNKALRQIVGAYDSSNTTRVYAKVFMTPCPYTNTKRRVYFYYRCTNGKPPSPPAKPSDVQDIFVKSTRIRENRERISASEREKLNNNPVGKSIASIVDEKKKAAETVTPEAPTNKYNHNVLPTIINVNNNNGDNTKNRYWSEPECRKLFGYDKSDESIDVVELLVERIELLKQVQHNEDGYQLVIPMTEEGCQSVSSHNIFVIRQKTLFLCRAYQIALEKLRVGVKWEDVCKEAVRELNNLGLKQATSGRTVMKWNREFNIHDKFPHPDPRVRMGKKPKPPIFELFSEIELEVKTFIKDHLDCFTIEMLRCELSEILPKHLEKLLKTDGDDSVSIGRTMLETFINKPPCYSTVLRWVHSLNYSYDTKAKSYMVDGHEHEQQREHRKWLTTEYITKLEMNAHRWIQMPVAKFEELPCSKVILGKGYTYTGVDNEPMIELHVDDHNDLQELANKKYEFGGALSVRISGKPLIIIGQDESVYNQFAFGNKQWVSEKGERAFLPKSDGLGIMISAMQSREFGFGMVITEEQLKDINDKRRRDGEYFDKVAAKEVYGDAKKKDLTESPFVRKLEYGSNKDGYWTGNHMIVQLEDCIDCLEVIYRDQYDFLFLFDHSSGHAKKRINGLDAAGMNKSHGGIAQHPTMIKEKDGYLGPFHDPTNPKMAQVGEQQSLMWSDTPEEDDGPIYLSPEQCRLQRDDQNIPLDQNKVRDVAVGKKALIREIRLKDQHELLDQQALNKMTLKELQRQAHKLGIETTYVKTHRLKTGWKGKGKGLLQILWERGFIDLSRLDDYRMRAEDADGNLIPELSLVHMMETCTDFVNETSQLEHVGNSLGMRVIITTKYHAEYAGEGIEYSWGYSKSAYRRNPLSAKKGKDQFYALVDKCISRDLITVDMVRKFSKRARGYMLAYKMLETDEMSKPTNNQADITHQMIEKMKKVVSSHRAALDFDMGFLKKIETKEGFNLVSEVASDKKGFSDSNKKKRKRQTKLSFSESNKK